LFAGAVVGNSNDLDGIFTLGPFSSVWDVSCNLFPSLDDSFCSFIILAFDVTAGTIWGDVINVNVALIAANMFFEINSTLNLQIAFCAA